MMEVYDFFRNIYIWAAVGSWLSAQSIKLILTFIKSKEWKFDVYASTGGMPSAHTATVIGLATAVGRGEGFSSAQFAVAFIFAIVVITDALHLRREVGRHAEALQEITKKKFNILSGHKVSEIIVGLLIGAIVGWFL